MNHSESIAALAAALAKAQATMPAVPKRGRGQVGQARTTYATLDDVIETLREPLAGNGLSFSQMLDHTDAGPSLTTMLLHESGEWLASTTPIDAMDPNRGTNEMQAYGSTLTYLKRYALAAMLGVATEDDDDGATAQHPSPRKAVIRNSPATAQTPPVPEEPRNLWEEEKQAAQGIPDELPYLDIAEVGVFLTKTGKPHIGLMVEGHKWPDIRWWKGRTELLEAAPWLIASCAHDDLVPDARFPFAARVYYAVDANGYKVAERFEELA